MRQEGERIRPLAALPRTRAGQGGCRHADERAADPERDASGLDLLPFLPAPSSRGVQVDGSVPGGGRRVDEPGTRKREPFLERRSR